MLPVSISPVPLHYFSLLPEASPPLCRLCSWPSASLSPLLERALSSPCAGGAEHLPGGN